MKLFRGSLLWVLILLGTARAESPRPIVVEQFTATWCTYCYAAGSALDRIGDATSRSEVIILAYHIDDGYQASCSDPRFSLYGGGGIPAVWMDGRTKIGGGLSKSDGEAGILYMQNLYNQSIEAEKARRGTTSPIDLKLYGNITSNTPWLSAEILSDRDFPNPVNIMFFVTEDNLRPLYASNGQTVLNSVVRLQMGSRQVRLNANERQLITVNSPMPVTCARTSELKAVVLVQDSVTREILNANGVLLQRNAAHDDWRLYQ